MSDTLLCYNKDQKCDDCGKPPVAIQHWGPITDNEMKNLCGDCWQKRLDAKQKE
jgi:hypothetical protein